MMPNQRSDGGPAGASGPSSSCRGVWLRGCSSDNFILIQLNLMEFKEMRFDAVSVQWLDFLNRRPLAREKRPLCFSHVHRKIQHPASGSICFSVIWKGWWWLANAAGVSYSCFFSMSKGLFSHAGETVEDLQTSRATAAFSAGLLLCRRRAQPAAACLPRVMLSGSRDV